MAHTYSSLQLSLSQHKRGNLDNLLDLRKVDFQKLQKDGNDLSKLDLSYTILSGIKFEDLNLSNVNFSYSTLYGVSFSGAVLKNANFTGADISGHFNNADLSDVLFENLQFIGYLNLEKAYFSTQSFYQLLDQLKKHTGNYYGKFFRHAILRDVDFFEGQENFQLSLNGLDLSDCDLQGANFSRMDLTKVEFKRNKVKGAQFLDTTLTPSQLVEFYQAGARDFSEVILNGIVSENFKKNSFAEAQLSAQAIDYLSKQGFLLSEAHLHNPLSYHAYPEATGQDLKINLLKKTVTNSDIIKKNVEEQFVESLNRQNRFYQLQKLLHNLKNTTDETITSLNLPYIDCANYANCELITYYWLQSLMQERENNFFASLEAVSQLEAHYQTDKPLSPQEKKDRQIFLGLKAEEQIPLQSTLAAQFPHYSLEHYLKNLTGNFFLQLSFPEKDQPKFLAIYRKGAYYNVIENDFIHVKNIKSLSSLIKILYSCNIDKFGLLKVVPQINNPSILWPNIRTETARLRAYDELFGNLTIGGNQISRTLLYELGASVQKNPNKYTEVDQLIDAEMNLKQKEVDNYIRDKRLGISADSYIQFIEKKINFSEEDFDPVKLLYLNRIVEKLFFIGNAEARSRALMIQRLLQQHKFSEWPNKLEPYFGFNSRRTRREIKDFKSAVKNIQFRNAFRKPQNKGFVKTRLELGKLYWELHVSKSTNEEFCLQLAELGYIQTQTPTIIKWKDTLETKLGFKTYVTSTATYKKITHWLNSFSYESSYSNPIKKGLTSIIKAPFDLIRIAQSGYALASNSEQTAKSYRDNTAIVVFSSASLSEGVLSDILEASSEFSTNFFIELTGLELAYKGLSELEEDKNYGLTFSENLNAYFRAALGLPQSSSLDLLKQRSEQIKNLKNKGEEFLAKNKNTIFAIALGKSETKNKLEEKSASGVNVQLNRGNYFKPQNYITELVADFATIELNSESDFAKNGFLSRLTPNLDNNQRFLLCGPTYQENTIYDPPGTGKKIETAVYYCNNALAISNTAEKNLKKMTFIYDLLLQNEGRTAANKEAKENIFFIKEGIQSIYGSVSPESKNSFLITGNFTGKLFNGQDVSRQINKVDTQQLKSEWLEFKEGIFYLNSRRSNYFTTQGITHFQGRKTLADTIDCTGSTLRSVNTLGGSATSWDTIKNCPTANLNTYSKLSADIEGEYVYYINSNDKFIQINEHKGTIELHFKDHDLLHENDFFYHFNEKSLEIRKKNSLYTDYLVRIKPYLNPGTHENNVKIYDKDNFFLEPVISNLDELSDSNKSQYSRITNFVYKTKTYLADNYAILDEYLQLISHTEGTAIFGIITQIKKGKSDVALKIIGSETINAVLPLGRKGLDFVYGGMGQDIYHLSFQDLESTQALKEIKTVHINNLAADNVIDSLAVPVSITELILIRDSENLVIGFLSHPKFKIVIDNYFFYAAQQHLLLIDHMGKEWIFKVKNLTQLSLIPYYRNLSMQLRYPIVSGSGDEINTFAVPGTFKNCLYFKDEIGMTLECQQEDDFPLEIPLFNFCRAGKNDLKLLAIMNGTLIDEEQTADVIDCEVIRVQQYLAFDRTSAVKKITGSKVHYELDPNKPVIIFKDSTQANVEKRFFIDDTAVICQMRIFQGTDLVFNFFDSSELLLGSFIVQAWNDQQNRVSVIESNNLYISGLKKWNLQQFDEIKDFVATEFLKAYLKKNTLINLNENMELVEELEALLLLLLTALADEYPPLVPLKINKLVLDKSKLREELKNFLKIHSIPKEALLNSLLWVCLNTNPICNKLLPDVVESLSFPLEDEKSLRNLFLYLNTILNHSRLILSSYSSLEKMITSITATGWNTTTPEKGSYSHQQAVEYNSEEMQGDQALADDFVSPRQVHSGYQEEQMLGDQPVNGFIHEESHASHSMAPLQISTNAANSPSLMGIITNGVEVNSTLLALQMLLRNKVSSPIPNFSLESKNEARMEELMLTVEAAFKKEWEESESETSGGSWKNWLIGGLGGAVGLIAGLVWWVKKGRSKNLSSHDVEQGTTLALNPSNINNTGNDEYSLNSIPPNECVPLFSENEEKDGSVGSLSFSVSNNNPFTQANDGYEIKQPQKKTVKACTEERAA